MKLCTYTQQITEYATLIQTFTKKKFQGRCTLNDTVRQTAASDAYCTRVLKA